MDTVTRLLPAFARQASSALFAVALICAPASAWADNGNGKGNGGAGREDRGNGGDRGRSDDRGNSDERGNRGGNGKGNGNGRANAPRDTRDAQSGLSQARSVATPGGTAGLSAPVADYRGAVLVARDAISVQNAAAVEYQTLIGLSQREIAQLFPNGGYNAALEQARVKYEQTTTRAHSAQAAVDQALRDFTGGRNLTAATRAELHRRLGL